MKIYLDNTTDTEFDFDHNKVAEDVCKGVLEQEKCPFECEINITITDNAAIKEINKQTRDIDKETDVLSFPGLFFDKPGEFDENTRDEADCVDPENGLIILGDIVLSADKIFEQASEYGHSVKREYAFLIAHSMLHLCGYDHIKEDEAAVMEEKQRAVLDRLNITRGN
ncbi:MAG: rRNA maturation RNase YbeY [Lachnospiraceae bacterium]|nr:rRNA maturation RNase YbeY [Lachnospiraceae bacterium]